MIGQTISHYTITARLGAGGMGEVYLATDSKLDRQVALKFLPDSLKQDPEARERLLREAKAASRLSQSHYLAGMLGIGQLSKEQGNRVGVIMLVDAVDKSVLSTVSVDGDLARIEKMIRKVVP